MGRSVSYLSNSLHTVFLNVGHFGIANKIDDDGNEIPGTEHYDQFRAQEDWDCMFDNLTSALIKAFPSLSKCNRWEHREDHIILENRHCEIGISEYGGMVSLSIRVSEYYDEHSGLALNWIEKIWPRMKRVIGQNTPALLVKTGSFSNGEGVYSPIEPQKSGVTTICHNGMGITYAA
jgi:hypothetical protein